MTGILRFTALAAGLAVAVAPPLHARHVDGWDVAQSRQGACMMTASFEQESIALVWHEADQQLGFLAASKNWNGLMMREGDPTSLHLTFDGDVRYPKWVHEGARFQPLRGTEAVMGTWGPEHRDELVEAMTRSSRVSIKVGDTDIGSFDITGAGKAYRELLRCGARA